MKRLVLKIWIIQFLCFSFGLSACIPTKKYDLLVQSMQKNILEKQEMTDSLQMLKAQLKEIDSLATESIFSKNKQIDSLKRKLDDLQNNYLSLQKNVFLQIQDLQKDKNIYKSQLAQRDSLLSQLIQQGKHLMQENQVLTEKIISLKKVYLPANALSKDNTQEPSVDSLQAKILREIGNFIGQEMSLKKQNDRLLFFLAHRLLFKNESAELTNDGEFMMNLIAKVLSNEANAEITITNYANEEMAEKDKWELSTNQSMEVMKKLLKSGLAENQLNMSNISSPKNIEMEVGSSYKRIELLVRLKK